MPTRKKISSLQQAIGQLLIVGFDGTEMSLRLSSILKRLQPSGVILFARNVVSARQTHELLQASRRLVSTPMFLCVDMEGGVVDRLKKALEPAPAPASVFATGDRRLFRKHGRVIGEECRALGFNVDFAPISDLGFPASHSVLGSRVVSDNARDTVVYVREFLRGLKDAGLLGCGKHFPGLGEGRLDSHQYLPVIEKDWKRIWAEDLKPYRVLHKDFPFIMVAHAAYPAVTGELVPASLSKKWMTEILRKKIGYRGLILSDDLEMGGVLASAPIESAAIAFIRAGGDICLVCHKEEAVLRVYEALVQEAGRDANFAKLVQERAKRVMAFKNRRPQLRRRGSTPSTQKVQQLTRQIWEFSEQVRLEGLARQEQT